MKTLIRSALASVGYEIRGVRHTPRQLLQPELARVVEFDDLVCRRMHEVGPELRFIQVGVFDGVTKDPLHKYIGPCRWTGLLVEPQPRAARQLRDLYKDNARITVVEAALDAGREPRSLYTVEGPDAPDWAGGMASFNRETIAKHGHLIAGLDRMIREISVESVTFDDLFDRLPDPQLDLLQIDTEGADGLVLSLFPFERTRPAIVHFEIKHLTKAEREACLQRLARFGYRFAPSGAEDLVATQF